MECAPQPCLANWYNSPRLFTASLSVPPPLTVPEQPMFPAPRSILNRERVRVCCSPDTDRGNGLRNTLLDAAARSRCAAQKPAVSWSTEAHSSSICLSLGVSRHRLFDIVRLSNTGTRAERRLVETASHRIPSCRWCESCAAWFV